MITALPTEALLLKHWEIKVHKATFISFCTAAGQSSDLAMLTWVPLETCPGVEMTKRYRTLPLLCCSCPADVFLCFIKQSLDKVTAEEQLRGQELHKQGRKGSKNQGEIQPTHNLIQHKKNILKCAWKARESNFTWECWILWWNPGLVISFSLHLSKEAETGTNNSCRIYLFGNICESLSALGPSHRNPRTWQDPVEVL